MPSTASATAFKAYPANQLSADTFSLALRLLAQHSMATQPVGLFLDGSPCSLHPKTNEWAILGIGAQQTLTWQAHQGKTFQLNNRPISFANQNPVTVLNQLINTHTPEAPKLPNDLDFLPFHSGWLGLLCYEAAALFDTAWQQDDKPNPFKPTTSFPELYWFQPETVWIAHLPTQQLWLLPSEQTSPSLFDLWPQALKQAKAEANQYLNPPPTHQIDLTTLLASYTPSLTEANYCQSVDALKTQIAQGEMFQANLSIRFQRQLHSPPKQTNTKLWQLYHHLAHLNPSPFSALLKTPHGSLLSNSPERLTQVKANQQVDTRPIAGTRGRGTTLQETQHIHQTLLSTPKEQAEHAMLVDLERNDLGRVCQPGTIHVNEANILEAYSHVTHLVSNITGTLAPKHTALDALAATFPGGTITGCPKVRCIQHLAHQEPTPRSFYTGSLGYLDPHRHRMDWNILIRTLSLTPQNTLALHAGAGIVMDSHPTHEYRECLRKAHALLQACHTVF